MFLALGLAGATADGGQIAFRGGASAIEVHVPKEGLLGFVAHEHVIEALDLDGILDWSDDGQSPQSLVVRVPVVGLRVMDTDIDDAERRRVQEAMLSAAVLDLPNAPVILFESDSITVQNSTLWTVRGQLTVRNQSAPVEIFAGIERYPDGRLRARGSIDLRLADFGINPVTALGGMIRTGKTVEVRFDFIGDPAAPPHPIQFEN